MTRLAAFALVAALAGCVATAPRPLVDPASSYAEVEGVTVPDSVSVADVAGVYRRGEYHGFRTLDLRADGTVAYHVFDASADVDTVVTGRWRLERPRPDWPALVTPDLLILRSPDGHVFWREPLQPLEVIRVGGTTGLVPLDARYDALMTREVRWPGFWREVESR